MAASEDVSLPDLQVIQRYSLAVRGATARRADVIAALRADLDWLTGAARTPRSAPAPVEPAAATKEPKAPAAKEPKAATKEPKARATKEPKAPVTKAPARKAAAKKAPATATRSGARRG